MNEGFFAKWYEITDWAEKMIEADPLLSKIMQYSVDIYDRVFVIGLLIAIISVIMYALSKKAEKGLYIKETMTNMFTLLPYYFTEIFF